MAFTPTYDNLSEREPLLATHYNTLVDDLQSALAEIDGTELAAPLTLSRSGQNLNGGNHYIYGFKKWLGTGNADVCIRDVTGYGATGDGSTNDRAAIQAAIDDCGVNGGCVFFPPGVYMIDNTIIPAGSTWNKNLITLMGSGFATEIKLMNGSNARMIQVGHIGQSVDGMTIQGIKLNGNSANQTTAYPALDLSGSVGCRVLNCWITDSKGEGIDIGDATDLLIQDSRVDSCVTYGISCARATGTRVIIDSCWIIGNTQSGIYMQSCPPDLIISNCLIANNLVNGIFMETGADAPIARFVIDSNTIATNGVAGLYDGIRIRSHYADVNAREFVISGNIITASGKNGIHLEAHPGQIRAFNLNGNVVKESKTHGILIENDCVYGAVGGNICNNNGQTVADSAGIQASTSGGLNAPSYLSLTSNNCCDDQASPTQDYGIWLYEETHHCVALGNVAVNNTTAQVQDDSTRNDVSHNVGT